MKVSIVTPSYNQSEFLPETIDSVAMQDYDNVEHIVVDGESTDGSVSILDDSDTTWVSEADRGQAHAINKGFNMADGDIVGWVNADDPLLRRDSVSKVVNAFRSGNPDIVYGHAAIIDRDTTLQRVMWMPEFDQRRLEANCYIIQPSVFFAANVVEAEKLNENYEFSMDYEYWLRLSERGYRWKRLDTVLSTDRNHENRKIISDASKSWADSWRVRVAYDIEPTIETRYRQIKESLSLRRRRINGITHMIELLGEHEAELACDLIRNNLLTSLKSQVFRRRKEL